MQEPIDATEVFEHVRDIKDPEHPYSLEQLDVVKLRDIEVDDSRGRVKVTFTPTVAHCSLGAFWAHGTALYVMLECCFRAQKCEADSTQGLSMHVAPLIGLCIRVKLQRSLPRRFKVDVAVTPGSHSTYEQVNKQLADKERTSAALESPALIDMVNRCLTS